MIGLVVGIGGVLLIILVIVIIVIILKIRRSVFFSTATGFHYFSPAGVQTIAISVSVCLSVCSFSVCWHILTNNTSKFYQMLPVAMARSSSDGDA